MKRNNLPSILDTSIRDGSYVFNFKFTKEDTFLIARGLSNAGIKHIEVGHGLGLKASEKKVMPLKKIPFISNLLEMPLAKSH